MISTSSVVNSRLSNMLLCADHCRDAVITRISRSALSSIQAWWLSRITCGNPMRIHTLLHFTRR